MANKAVMRSKMKSESNYLKAEKSIMSRLVGYFEDSETLKDDTLLDSQVLQGVLFVLTNRSEEVLHNNFRFLMPSLAMADVLHNQQIQNMVLSHDFLSAFGKFETHVDKKLPDLDRKTFALFRKVLCILFEFFDFEKKLYDEKGNYLSSTVDLCERLLNFCFLTILGNYNSMFFANKNKEEKQNAVSQMNISKSFLKDKAEWVDALKNYPLKAEYMPFLDCSDSIKEDFALLYDIMTKNWHYAELDGDKELRNSLKSLDGVSFQNDMTLFIDILKKDFYDKCNVKKINGKEFFDFEKGDEKIPFLQDKDKKLVFDKYIKMIIKNYSFFYSSFLITVFNLIVGRYTKDKVTALETDKADLNSQLKEMKGLNRNLTKNVQKLDTEIKGLKSEIEKAQEGITVVQQMQEDNEELKALREKVKELESQNVALQEENRKVTHNNQWLENRVEGLEFNLNYYQELENDLLILQNENNVLNAQIERIETLENEVETDDYEEKLKEIQYEPIMFIGGYANMNSKLLELFPNAEIITLSEGIPNFNIPPRIKYVAIFTRMIKHSYCERAESIVGKENIISLNIFNARLVVEELYKNIVGHKNKN